MCCRPLSLLHHYVEQVLTFACTLRLAPLVHVPFVSCGSHHDDDDSHLRLLCTLFLSVRLFLPHRFQFHFRVDIPSFLPHIHLPVNCPDALHPAFLNAAFLLACHLTQSISQSPIIASYERIFLQRTRAQLERSLAYADRLTHFLWGSTFLGSYYTRCGRFVEAYNTISAAVRFAVGCDIDAFSIPRGAVDNPYGTGHTYPDHQAASTQPGSDLVIRGGTSQILTSSESPDELLRRTYLWDAMFLIDKTLVQLSGMPSSVPSPVRPPFGNQRLKPLSNHFQTVGLKYHISTFIRHDT